MVLLAHMPVGKRSSLWPIYACMATVVVREATRIQHVLSIIYTTALVPGPELSQKNST